MLMPMLQLLYRIQSITDAVLPYIKLISLLMCFEGMVVQKFMQMWLLSENQLFSHISQILFYCSCITNQSFMNGFGDISLDSWNSAVKLIYVETIQNINYRHLNNRS